MTDLELDLERELKIAVDEIVRLDLLVSFYKEIAECHRRLGDANAQLRDAAVLALKEQTV